MQFRGALYQFNGAHYFASSSPNFLSVSFCRSVQTHYVHAATYTVQAAFVQALCILILCRYNSGLPLSIHVPE
jgi:hypothetical protein